MTIVNDSCLFVCLFYIHIYIQFIDVSGLLDFHKSNGTNGIRKERKWVCQHDMTKISSVVHGAMLHRYSSPCIESTAMLVSATSRQTGL